jgi:periplasmic protein CpxP/Spy
MLHKSIFIIIGLIALVVLAACGCHHGRPRFHRCFSPERKAKFVVKKVTKELKLNDQQKAELESMISDIHGKMETLHNGKGAAVNTLTDEIKKDTMDQTVLNTLFDDHVKTFNEVRVYATERFIKFHQLLTPEQRQKLAEKIQEFHKECRH